VGQAASAEGLTLVPLSPGDLPQVCAIEAACFATPWSLALFEEELKRPEVCHWLCLKNAAGEVAAYGGFWRAVDEAHFTNVAVAPPWQRQGLGRRLVQELLDLAKRQGCLRATLEVRPSNEAALALYQAQGFKAVAMRPGYYSDNGEDAMILWKDAL